MQPNTSPRLAWGLAEIATATGLSVAFLRKQARTGALPTRKIGGRVLVLDQDLHQYLQTETVRGGQVSEPKN